jgi:tRNA-specific 2-thiouridylase
VLWGLSQECLSKTILPLGNFRKTEIKALAKEWGYFDLANKPESYEICFIPDNDYRSFLKRRVPTLESKVDGGDFVLTNGEVVGKHKGYPFYTIGQRKGLEIALGKPLFVVEIDPISNKVYLGDESDLQRRSMTIKNVNLQKYASLPEGGMEVLTKIRYKDTGAISKLTLLDDGITYQSVFNHQVKAIAPGQSAVWYEGNDVVGGGNIWSAAIN